MKQHILDIMQGAAAVARACYFDTEKGFGVFASLPLVRRQLETYNPDVSLGLRYSSPQGSVGVIGLPLNQQISKAWAVRNTKLPVTN